MTTNRGQAASLWPEATHDHPRFAPLEMWGPAVDALAPATVEVTP